MSRFLAAQQERILPSLQARTGELYEAGSFISQGQGTRGKKRWKKARHVRDPDVQRMNILLVGSCTKKQATPSREETERQRERERERMTKQEERYEETRQEEKETIALGQLTVRETKKYPRINLPSPSPLHTREVVPLGIYSFTCTLLRTRVFTRIEKFRHVSRRRCLNIQMEASPAAAIRRDIASLRNPLYPLASESCETVARVFHAETFENCRFRDAACFTENRAARIDVNNK